jgi:hypothetical protein
MRYMGFALIVAVTALLFSAMLAIHFGTKQTVEFTVQHRERVAQSDGSGSVYMIWAHTNNGTEVFKNTDSVLDLKFNSADVYGRMAPGAQCTAVVNGFRVPVLSMNRNILQADCSQP